MKMYMIALFALSAGIASGQISGPDPPKTSTWANAPAGRLPRQPGQLPSPAGGFWVIEEIPKRSAIAHFYADSKQEIRSDTLRRRHLNLKSRVVVMRFNRRLHALLDHQPAPASVAVRLP